MVLWTAAFLYQSTIINPMLAEIYQMEPEKSTLFFTIAGIAFLVATPVAFELRKRRMAKRRSIQYVSLVGMGVGMIIRTGNFGEEPHLWWVYVGQCINGIFLALLTTTSFPEIVDCMEKTPLYPYYEKDHADVYVSGFFVFI